VVALRLILAAVFAVAGVSKLADRAGSRQSMRGFGVPAALAPAMALLLPIGELACAAALLLPAWAALGGAGALTLLTLFVVAIAANMVRGRRPDCHCFGQLHSSPAGPVTLARNLVLAAIAAAIIWPERILGFAVVSGSLGTPKPFFGEGGGRMEIILIVAVAALWIFVLVALYQILRQNGRILRRLDAIEAKLGMSAQPTAASAAGLAVDTAAPDFRLARLDGGTTTLAGLREDSKRLLLFFTEPNCAACDGMLADVAKWQHEHADALVIVPIGRGDVEANRAKARAHGLHNVLLQKDNEVADAYRADRAPSAVLIAEGRVAAALAVGADAIRALVRQATMPPPLKKGDRVPSLRLRDLNGGTSDLAVLGGRATLLLFWNPACGFCQAMLDEVKAWERDRSDEAPQLVVISAGSPKSNREQGFRSRVLLDPPFNAGARFGAEGTPSAVLVDEQGRVASAVGVGAKSVMALAGASPIAVVR